MANEKVQMRPKDKKVKKEKKPMNWSWINRSVDALAILVVYLLLFTSSAYGIRRFLDTIPDWANIGITSIIVLGMVYIIFRNKK